MKDPVSLKLTFSARDKVFFSYSEYFILIMSGHAANIIQNRWSHYLYSIPTVQGKKVFRQCCSRPLLRGKIKSRLRLLFEHEKSPGLFFFTA